MVKKITKVTLVLVAATFTASAAKAQTPEQQKRDFETACVAGAIPNCPLHPPKQNSPDVTKLEVPPPDEPKAIQMPTPQTPQWKIVIPDTGDQPPQPMQPQPQANKITTPSSGDRSTPAPPRQAGPIAPKLPFTPKFPWEQQQKQQKKPCRIFTCTANETLGRN